MDIDHIHFYVPDISRSRQWFINHLGVTTIGAYTGPHHQTELLQAGPVSITLSSPSTPASPIAQYLNHHPPGVADLALRVRNLPTKLEQIQHQGVRIIHPLQTAHSALRWATIQGWGDVQHTLVEFLEPSCPYRAVAGLPSPIPVLQLQQHKAHFIGIDHAVLNVAAQQLPLAVAWYQQCFGFQSQRYFDIQTQRSALHSQVLIHPEGTAKLPINEPAAVQPSTEHRIPSQIQEFLNHNRGSGIQHIALGAPDITKTIAALQDQGLQFLDIPPAYYQQLRQQALQCQIDVDTLEKCNVLAEIQRTTPPKILLQTFTKPIFDEPTFFFEVIERREQAQGFGEKNFTALFEAIEREQLKREACI